MLQKVMALEAVVAVQGRCLENTSCYGWSQHHYCFVPKEEVAYYVFELSAASSSDSLNFTVDLFPELALEVREGARGGTAAGGSSQSCSGTISLLLDEDFADGMLCVLFLDDLAESAPVA